MRGELVIKFTTVPFRAQFLYKLNVPWDWKNRYFPGGWVIFGQLPAPNFEHLLIEILQSLIRLALKKLNDKLAYNDVLFLRFILWFCLAFPRVPGRERNP
jgi:hypothetical protein